MTARVRKAFVVVAVAAVAASVLGGLLLLGSPRTERERRLDARRVADMRALASAVDLYWTRQGQLPSSLATLAQERGIQPNRVDPENGRPYDYRVVGENAYELCAQFARDASEEGRGRREDFWTHGSGLQCFRLAPKTVKR
jgi:hypothetical protein